MDASPQPDLPPAEASPPAAASPAAAATAAAAPPPVGAARRGFWSVGLYKDFALAGLLCLFVLVFLFQPFRVEGVSMLPHFADHDRILVDKLSYRFADIQRGDVVVFWYPEDPSKSFLKRVVGLPGDVVEIRDGTVLLNHQAVDEPYVEPGRHEDRAPVTVRRGYYYVLGDHRDKSFDSRFFGLVPERYIYGKVVFSYWPPSRAGFVDGDAAAWP